MAKFRVEIKKILERGICNFGFKVGDVFEYEDDGVPETFPNFCAWAFREIFPALLVLKYGGSFPWESEPNVVRMCCSDAKNPVVFKITRIET